MVQQLEKGARLRPFTDLNHGKALLLFDKVVALHGMKSVEKKSHICFGTAKRLGEVLKAALAREIIKAALVLTDCGKVAMPDKDLNRRRCKGPFHMNFKSCITCLQI